MRLPRADETELRDACRDVLSKRGGSTRARVVMESESGIDDDFWKLAAELGWTALAVPESLGGIGGSVGELATVAEELGRVLQPGLLVETYAVSHVLSRYPGAADDLLEAVAEGTAMLTWGGLGPDSPTPHGTVDLVPDALTATHLAVPVQFGDERRLVIVERSDVAVEVLPTMDLTRRYARVRLDAASLDGAIQLPGIAADELFDLAVVLQCAESSGVARQLLDMTITYAKQRKQFGRPIGGFQAIKHRIADMLIEAEGCRVATREAADALDGGAVPGSEAVSIAKSWVGRAASFVASHALQIHGGIGFSWEHDLHLYLRRAKTNELLLGSPDWHDERLYRAMLARGHEQSGVARV